MVSQVESFEQAKQSNATATKCASILSDFTPTSQIDTEEMDGGGAGCLIDNVFGQWTTVLPWTNNAFAHIL